MSAPRTKDTVIEELCRLRSLVNEHVFAYSHASDCVCGAGDRRRVSCGLPVAPPEMFRDSGAVTAFIRAAVVEKIAAVKQGRRTARTTITRPVP